MTEMITPHTDANIHLQHSSLPWLLCCKRRDWPEKHFELSLVQRLWGEHLIDSGLLWLLAPEACRDVDWTNTSHAVKKQIGRLCCQDAGEGKQARVGETKERGVEVAVDDSCYGAVIIAWELVERRVKTLEVDFRPDTFLEWCRQNYNVIQLWFCPSCRGVVQLVLWSLCCVKKQTKNCVNTVHRCKFIYTLLVYSVIDNQ